VSLAQPSTPGHHEQQEQATLLAHRYGLNLDKDEHDELVWLIETMGLEEAEAECARSRAMLIRSGQLDSNHAIWESEGGGVSRQGPAGQLPSPTSSHRMSGQ